MAKRNYIIPFFVPHLGCTHRCVFCRQWAITGAAGLPRGAEVEEKITEYLRTIPLEPEVRVEVAFYGGSFTAVDAKLQEELLKPAFNALKKGKIKGIRVSTRPDAVGKEQLELLRTYGVDTVELGVQSTDDEVLRRSFRGHSAKDVFDGAQAVKKAGFRLGLQMMTGLPGDNGEKALKTAQDLVAMGPDFVRIYPAVVIRGTNLAEMMQEGQYNPPGLEETVELLAVVKQVFNEAGIPVIRLGLQASAEIGWDGEVVAGPWHPAIGELVEARMALKKIRHLLAKVPGNALDTITNVTLKINPSDESCVRGHQRENIAILRGEGIEVELTKDSSVNRGHIVLTKVNGAPL